MSRYRLNINFIYCPPVKKAEFLLCLLLLVLAGIFFTPLMVNNESYDPTRMGKIFFFARWMLLLIPVGLLACFLNSKQPIGKLSLFLLIWGIWIIVRGKNGGIWYDEKFFWLSGCFIFYFFASILLKGIIAKGNRQLLRIPLLVISLVAAIESVFGFLQLYGRYPVYHGQFKITGTFFNPAPYSGFLLASMPWVFLLLSIKTDTLTKKIIYWVIFIIVCALFIVLPSTRSRAAYLGLGVVLLFWSLYRYHPFLYLKKLLNTPLKRRVTGWSVAFVFVVVLTGLYLFKKDSANGRLLIWKVAMQTIKEQPFIGNGFNTTQATIVPAQAAYFAAEQGSEREKMLAGSVRWTFNEFLQITSETGFVGLAFFLLIIGYALFSRVLSSFSRQQKLMIGAARASLGGILVFGCFSYPFYSLPVTLLFFFALSVLSALLPNKLNIRSSLCIVLKIPFGLASVCVFVFYLQQTSKLKQAYWYWNEAGQLYQVGAYSEANDSFAEALPILTHNGLFLQQYGKSLEMTKKYSEAIRILNRSTLYYNDEFTGIILGNCYKAIGEYDKAEQQYQEAANTVPHKFYPLYLLAKLYNEIGETAKATKIARELLNKKIKVPSTAIEEIKAEMQQLIDTTASLQNSNKPEEKRQEAHTCEHNASCPAPSPKRKGGKVTKIINNLK